MTKIARQFLLAVAMTPVFIFSSLQLGHAEESNIRRLYWVHLEAPTQEQRSQLANLIHIDQVVEDSVYSVVSEDELKALKQQLPEMLKQSHLISEQDLDRYQQLQGEEFPKGEEAFTTYDEMETELRSWATNYPDFVELMSIGKSLEGRDLWAVKIGPKDLPPSSMIPAILFTGAHHAREHLSTEVPLKLGRMLVTSYGTNPEVTRLIENRQIYIVPMVNPDGAMWDIVGQRYKLWRKNRRGTGKTIHGVDLNRNYGFHWNTGGSSGDPGSEVYHGPSPFSEPETIAIKSFVESIPNLRILLTFHTFSELILYPWGHSNDPVTGKDGEVFKQMAQTMSKWNGYTPKQSSGLYIASGDTCDWAYGERQIFCFTFELSPRNAWGPTGFYPGAKAIEPTYQANVRPALYLIDLAADPYSVLSPKLF